MKFLSILMLLLSNYAMAQYSQQTLSKPTIDTSVLGKWPTIDDEMISADGKYVAYLVSDKRNNSRALFIRSVNGKWEREISNAASPVMKGNRIFFLKGEDTLGIIQLGAQKVEYMQKIRSFAVSGDEGWLVFHKEAPADSLVIRNLSNGKLIAFANVTAYLFSPQGSLLLIESTGKSSNDTTIELQAINLSKGQRNHVHTGITNRDFVFDNSERELVFTSPEKSGMAIWQYKMGTQKAIRVGEKSLQRLDSSWIISDLDISFTNDNQHLLFGLNRGRRPAGTPKASSTDVIIWSFNDPHLPTEHNNSTRYYAVLDTQKDSIIFLNKESEQMYGRASSGDHMLFFYYGLEDGYYNKMNGPYIVLVNIKNGDRIVLSSGDVVTDYQLSPDEHFVTWFDAEDLTWYCYEIATKTKRNISQTVPNLLYDSASVEIRRNKRAAFGLGGWEPGDSAFFLYDKYDIWKVDPFEKKLPTNITNGYGRRHETVFTLMNVNPATRIREESANDKILLSGYNPGSKYNGFWETELSNGQDPELKTMGPYCYYIGRTGATGINEYPNTGIPAKAKTANRYLVKKMSAGEYPNLYVTDDFRSFQPISNLHPEKTYNWLNAQLVSWKMLDGGMSQGILYKPENFDSTKKYPLIFDYYEKRSDDLFKYREPNISSARIDIPYYVSNGYLIFVPDIYYKPGHNGQGVLNAIISAAKYLAKFSWVDSTKLGIQGHSFGGWETNFLISHTNLFAAACEAAGAGDQISGYGQISGSNGGSRHELYEISSQGSPYGIGVTPWTRPDLYTENSPVLFAGNVTTPLLMMHGDKDEAVPFPQAIEMFLALRRAGKRVWLLHYPNAGHHLNGNNAVDFTIRMKQFFDHYLKGKAAPSWMTVSAPL